MLIISVNNTQSNSFLISNKIRFAMLVTLIFVLLVALCSMEHVSQNLPFQILGILTCLLVIFFCTTKLILFYVIFEMSLIPITIIIMGWGYQPERLQARLYLIIYTFLVRIFYVILISSVFNMNLYFGVKIKVLVSNILMLLILIPFFVKIPVFLLHLWLPKAHVESPVFGSIVLAGILLKMGRYGLFIIIRTLNFNKSDLTSVCYLMIILSFFSTCIRIIQTDQKKK